MNRSILIVICDFLLLSLLTFSTDINHMANQNSRQVATMEVVTNPVANANTDLAAVMKMALQDEHKNQAQLQQQLASARQTATTQESQNEQLQQQFSAAQTNIASLNQQLQNTSTLSQQQIAERTAEERQQAQLADSLRSQLKELSQSNQLADAQQQQLVNQLQLAEVEKTAATQKADLMQQEIDAARAENARLAEGFKSLATNSAELTAEIRNNTVLAPNTIFSDFVSNRVDAAISGERTSFFSMDTSRDKQTKTILVTDGTNIYAVCHVDATPLKLWDPGTDWNKLTGDLSFNAEQVPVHALSFNAQDPRVVMIPVSQDEARQLGSKIYRLSSDPYKFQDAVLIGADEGYYGQCSFQIELNTPQYVKLDRNLLKGLFGQFNPSRGDFVFSGAGELLGIMVNNTYCLTIRDFETAATFVFNKNLKPTGVTLASLYDYVFQMPQQLQ
ncbi:MAG TPA: hypothetical protein VGI03_11850 [Verrucomicrobiae bacterium]|jgi:hypothetical protein